jgi:hypothetical protein
MFVGDRIKLVTLSGEAAQDVLPWLYDSQELR